MWEGEGQVGCMFIHYITKIPMPTSPHHTPPSYAHMVRIGATRSRLAMTTPTSANRTVRMRAKLGSPLRPVRLKKLRTGIRLSLAMAWSSLGALCKGRNTCWSEDETDKIVGVANSYPVRDCSPAPMVERRAPIRITHCDGHDSSATVSPLE